MPHRNDNPMLFIVNSNDAPSGNKHLSAARRKMYYSRVDYHTVFYLGESIPTRPKSNLAYQRLLLGLM